MSDGHDDFILGKFGPIPDDAEALKRGLKKALEVIGAYELDCRAIEDYVTLENMGKGFCQGEYYREAVGDVFHAMANEPRSRAAGGLVGVAQPYVINEDGPELFVANEVTYVIPQGSDQLQRLDKPE